MAGNWTVHALPILALAGSTKLLLKLWRRFFSSYILTQYYRPCTFTGQKSSEIRYWGTNSLFTNFQLIWSKFLYVIGEYSLLANPLLANFLHMIKRAFQVDLLMRPLFANIRYSRIRYSRTSLYFTNIYLSSILLRR